MGLLVCPFTTCSALMSRMLIHYFSLDKSNNTLMLLSVVFGIVVLMSPITSSLHF